MAFLPLIRTWWRSVININWRYSKLPLDLSTIYRVMCYYIRSLWLFTDCYCGPTISMFMYHGRIMSRSKYLEQWALFNSWRPEVPNMPQCTKLIFFIRYLRTKYHNSKLDHEVGSLLRKANAYSSVRFIQHQSSKIII